jgi:uncharacterized protein YutE (UPF0331/DUF86 family)
MVNHEKIMNKLKIIKLSLEKLHTLKAIHQDKFLNDFTYTDTTRHNLQISIEAMLDIASHIIARNGLEFPKSNADAFTILGRHGILSKDKITVYEEMARFRNRLVHLYDDVDNLVIYEIVQNHLNDYESFIRDIVGFINEDG